MAKGSRGGQRGIVASTLSSQLQSQQQNQPVQIDTSTQATSFDKEYDDFSKMSEDERIDAIAQAIQEDVPVHLSNTDFQKVVYNLGFNDKPDLVDDKTFDTLKGTTIYRTINSVYDSKNDINYTPTDIAQQIQMGSTTRTSDNGGSVYGRGIYFADSYNDSASYGNRDNDITKTAIIRAKLNSNANVINYRNAVNGANNEISNGTKLGKMLSKCDSASRSSIYALVKGYNVVDANNGYLVILNRKATTISKTIKPTHYGKGW